MWLQCLEWLGHKTIHYSQQLYRAKLNTNDVAVEKYSRETGSLPAMVSGVGEHFLRNGFYIVKFDIIQQYWEK